ncbi:MerR family transcriptional regulator [Cohnella soli]|uniref:MerR family transcriptional regulator n=1 Tax=Cohnella soli TaxID=425005 RepID=A0ABW0HPX4_9BACL
MEQYKIDDVAKACGLTKRTIRYYEEIGILMPPERSEGGMRLYTQQHIDRLNQIIKARDVLGYTLQEIQDFVAIREEMYGRRNVYKETGDEAAKKLELIEIKRVVAKQLEMIDQKLQTMTEFRKEIDEIYQRVCKALES